MGWNWWKMASELYVSTNVEGHGPSPRPHSKLSSIVALLLLLLLISGCRRRAEAPTGYTVRLNGFSTGASMAGRTYAIMPSNPKVSDDDLEFLEYRSYIARILDSRQLRRADDLANADVVVFLAYGIGDPQEHYYSYSTPVWGQTGVSSSTTTSNVNVVGNTATVQSQTQHTPSYGVTGYQSHIGSYTTYTKWIIVRAYDRRALEQGVAGAELWKTEINSTGSNGDLRALMPVMLGAGIDVLGTNTGRVIERVVVDNPQTTLWLRGIKY